MHMENESVYYILLSVHKIESHLAHRKWNTFDGSVSSAAARN